MKDQKEPINTDGIQVSQDTANWVKLIYDFEDFYGKVMGVYCSIYGDDMGDTMFDKEMSGSLTEVNIKLEEKLMCSIREVMGFKKNRNII